MRISPTGRLAVVLALLAGQAGCAATYEPRPSPRIAPVHTNGRVFVRDGQRIEVGLLGGGGADALVAGNDLASTYARRHQRDRILGWSFYGLAIGTFVTSVVMSENDHAGLGAGLSLAALAPFIVSMVLHLKANAELHDAVNIYNDALESPPAPNAFAAPPPPPGDR